MFSGAVQSDTRYQNTTQDAEERFGSLIVMRGKEQFNVPVLHAGDIGVVAKLNSTKTGDTFSAKDNPIQVKKPDFPDPLYLVAVTPRTQADSAKSKTTPSVRCRILDFSNHDVRQPMLSPR